MPARGFAEADRSPDDSDFVILGVPFDSTSSFRPGSRFAPDEIRKASYNFETYVHDAEVDLTEVRTCDLGDLEEHFDPDAMVRSVKETLAPHVEAGRIPIVLGGEHSVTAGAVAAVRPDAYFVVDAHLDYRDEYLGQRNSHACSLRRVSEIPGLRRITAFGVRSMDKKEAQDAGANGVEWISADVLKDKEPSEMFPRQGLPERIYLSIDIDGIDPAYAPGTGTPEPFGLTAIWVRDLVRLLAPVVVGFDVVEVCPPYDNGNTSALAAKLVREFLAWHGSSRKVFR